MNILFVCHGNVCRSPLAEVVFKRTIEGKKHQVQSAGFTGPGRPAAKKVREFAETHGYDLSNHRSRLVSRELIDWCNIVYYMDNRNLADLRELSSRVEQKAVCLGLFIGKDKIRDPGYMKRGPRLDAILNSVVEATILGAKEGAKRNPQRGR